MTPQQKIVGTAKFRLGESYVRNSQLVLPLEQ